MTVTPPTKERLGFPLLITVLAVAFGTNFGIYNNAVVNNLKPMFIDYMNRTSPVDWLVGPDVSFIDIFLQNYLSLKFELIIKIISTTFV